MLRVQDLLLCEFFFLVSERSLEHLGLEFPPQDLARLVLGQGVDEHDAGLELLVRGDALRGPVDDGLLQDVPARGTMELLTDYKSNLTDQGTDYFFTSTTKTQIRFIRQLVYLFCLTTYALGSSPALSSGTPTTATSSTPGQRRITSSSSEGAT